MTLQEFIEFGAALSAIVASIVESIKYGFLQAWFAKLQAKYSWDDAQAHTLYVSALTVISIAVGIFVALANGAEANILTQLGYNNVHPVFGILITGVLLAFGNQFWHALFDLVKTLPTYVKVQSEAISQTTYLKQGNWQPVYPPETK